MKTILLLLSLLLAAEHGLAARPVIGVDFHLEESTYQRRFPDADIRRLEALCEAGLAEVLSRALGFADFLPLDAQFDRLVVRLGEAGGSGLRPIFFHLDVEGPGVRAERAPLAWRFRDLTEFFNAIEDVKSFAGEIVLRFEGHLEQQRDQLVDNLLSSLALTHQAFLILDDAAWVLPFSRDELGADEDSEFRIRAELVIEESQERPSIDVRSVGETLPDHTGVPAEYRHKIKTRIKDQDPQLLGRLRRARDVRVLHVFLTRYVRFEPLEEPLPSELDVTAGGAP